MSAAIASKYLLPFVIGLIMLNLGLSLRIRDFKKTFVFPRAIFIGLSVQMLVLPLVAFGLASLSNLPPLFKVGIVLISACPGGATSNLISYWLKGDVALSITLTTINSILILFTIPGITFLALNIFTNDETYLSLPFLPTVIKIILMILFPAFLGLLFRYRSPRKARNIEKYLKYISTFLLAIVYIFTISHNKSDANIALNRYLKTFPFVLALNLIGMLSGLLSGYFTKLKTNQIITLIIEIGIQNSALAITIASSQVFLGNSVIAVPAIVYGLFTFFNALLFGFVGKKWLIKKNVG